MKTIVCGPPHSGKSVLISNLVRLMPSDSFQRITANGDGEGTWSNNPNQKDVASVRYKSSNSAAEFADWERRIKTAVQDIVLVDTGGKIQDEKIPLFEACDNFIILSNNADIALEWKKFGENHSCKCLAMIDSTLDGQECIYSHEPFLHAKIVGLERGRSILYSIVLNEIANLLVIESNYKLTRYVDLFEIGRKLGFGSSWLSSNGNIITNVFFPIEKAPVFYHYLKDNYSPNCHYKLIGAKANWVSCVAASCLCTDNVTDLSFYDEWTNSFVHPAILSKADIVINNDIEIHTEEDEDSILLQFKIKTIDIDICSFRGYILPLIDESKDLYISGKFPNWFIVSIMKSYSNTTKFLHQPGVGYYCVETKDPNKLGSISEKFITV